MALSLKDRETDRLARQVASLTGETLTEAIRTALTERLQRVQAQRSARDETLIADLMAIARHCASLPELDPRSADEIIGYDENGMW